MRLGIAAGLRRHGGIGGRNRLAAIGLIRERPDPEISFLRSHDFAARVVYDVGASEGMFTLFFASRVGALGHVVAFEPQPESYERLVTNVALNGFGNVTAIPVAVGAERGELTFSTPTKTGSMSASPDVRARMGEAAQTSTFRVTSVDAEIDARNLPQPDFIKIDVEGLEFDVLRGMRQTLNARTPDLFIEVHGADMEAKRRNSAGVAEILLGAGYTLIHVETGNTVTSPDDSPARGHIFAASGPPTDAPRRLGRRRSTRCRGMCDGPHT